LDETLQTWANFGEEIVASQGLTEGAYSIKILFSIEGTGIAGTIQDGPFTATFSISDSGGDPLIIFASLHSPGEATIMLGYDEITAYARVNVEGLTGENASETGVDGLMAWIGYSQTDAQSTADFNSGWTWVPATYNQYEAEFGQNSQYSATFGSEIEYWTDSFYVSRFQLNGGNYVYGGYSSGGGGFWNGTTNVSGYLTVIVNSVTANDYKIDIYPNPTSGFTVVNVPFTCNISIYDISGRVVYSAQNISETTTIDLSDKQPGLYIVRVYGKDIVLSGKIIKR
jgi:hypothetical protein